jgi:hypothetical protein
MINLDLGADKTLENLTIKDLLKLASKGSVVFKTVEGREFVFAEIDDDDADFEEEVALLSQNEEFMQFLEERSKAKKKYSLAEIKERLGLTG